MNDLALQAEGWAEEAARQDLAFAGDAPWAGITAEQRKQLEAALIYYARSAARRTVRALREHGHLAK